MIKLVVFDYDGVIVDSFESVYKVYQHIFKRFDKPCQDKIEDFKKMYTRSHVEMLKDIGFSDKQIGEVEDIFGKEIVKYSHKFYDQIEHVIRELNKRAKLVIISHNFKHEVEQKIKTLGVLDCFQEIVGFNPEKKIPKSESILRILKENNTDADEAVLIGDTNSDYKNAKAAGLKHVIMVEYGWGYKKEELIGHMQTITVHKPLDILRAFDALK